MQLPTVIMPRPASVLASFGVGLALVSLLAGKLSYPLLGTWESLTGISAGLGLAAAVAILVRARVAWEPAGFLAALVLAMLTDWINRPYSFFQGPSIRGEIILFTAAVIITARRPTSVFLHALLAGTMAVLAACFFIESQGRILYSDDHSVFFFRFSLLTKTFPNIPFFYPLWNAGIDARDFFATGALNVYLLFAPLLHIAGPEHAYNAIVVGITCLFLPLSIYLAGRLEGLTPRASAVAALLALSSSLVWYRWALKYGTMGFLMTACLAPLNLSLFSRLLRNGDWTREEAILAGLSIWLMLLWAPSGLVLAPLMVIATFRSFSLLKSFRVRATAILLLALVAAHLTIVWSVSNVGEFLKADKPSHASAVEPEAAATPFRHRAAGLNLAKSMKVLRETAQSANPLLLILAIPGIALLSPTSRILFSASSLWLLCLGTVAVPVKPQLELDRMLVILLLYLCLPVGRLLIEAADGMEGKSAIRRLLPSAALGLLLTGPFSAAAVFLNRTVEQYHFAEPAVSDMAEAIKAHAGNGRVLFSGFVLHELSEGHLAPLSEITGVPLIASSPFHNRWRYTQIFPKSFLERGDAGIEDYLRLMNVTAVLAHEKEWRDYFNARPERYEFVWRSGRWSMFKIRAARENYVLEGGGALIQQSTASVTLRLDTPSALLSFTYFPFLEISACTVSPAQLSPELTLIRVENCTPGTTVTIRAAPLWKRILIHGD